MDPRPGRTVVPGRQEHPVAVEETTETEVAAMFEEVAADNPVVVMIDPVIPIEIMVPIGTVE